MNLLHVRDLLWTRADRLLRRHGNPSISGFLILTILEGAGTPLSPQDISQRMFLTPGTMTGLIGTLEKHGYVRSAKAAGRGRHVLISLTDEGRRVQRETVRELDPRMAEWLGCLDQAEKLSLLGLLGKLGTYFKSTPDAD